MLSTIAREITGSFRCATHYAELPHSFETMFKPARVYGQGCIKRSFQFSANVSHIQPYSQINVGVSNHNFGTLWEKAVHVDTENLTDVW